MGFVYFFSFWLVVDLIFKNDIRNILAKDSIGILVDVWIYWYLVVFFAVMKKKIEIFFGEYLKIQMKRVNGFRRINKKNTHIISSCVHGCHRFELV